MACKLSLLNIEALISNDNGLDEAKKTKYTQNAKELMGILNKLQSSLTLNGWGEITVTSTYRTWAEQTALYNKYPATSAKPGCSAHGIGAAADTQPSKYPSGKNYGDYVKFVVKWMYDNNIKFDLVIDESYSSSIPNGWCHIGVVSPTGTRRCHSKFIWEGKSISPNTFTNADGFIQKRNELANETSTDVGNTGGGASGSSSNNSSSSNNNVKYEAPQLNSKGVKQYTADEYNKAVARYNEENEELDQDAIKNAAAEYALLKGTQSNYNTYIFSEAEVSDFESNNDIDSDGIIAPTTYTQSYNATTDMAGLSTPSSVNVISGTDPESNLGNITIEVVAAKVEKKKAPRIYKTLNTTIEVNSMVVNRDGLVPTLADDDGNYIDNEGVITNDNGLNEKLFNTAGSLTAKDIRDSVGYAYPHVVVGDRPFKAGEIIKFSLYNNDFIPTISISAIVNDNTLLKVDSIKEGTICSVFMHTNNNMVKSYRADYIVTGASYGAVKTGMNQSELKVHISAELYIPKLYDNTITFSEIGTAKDVLIKAASRIGLGFALCDVGENSVDTQLWQCVATGNKTDIGGKTPFGDFIKNTAAHAYKNFNSFYDCWIDPRYLLTFIDVNMMLGKDGLDEDVDAAIMINSNTNTILNVGSSATNVKDKVIKQPKILSNIVSDDITTTPFYVLLFKELNDQTISKKFGLKKKFTFALNNGAISDDKKNFELEACVCTNKTKLLHGFYILGGPGQSTTHLDGNNGEYENLHTVTAGGSISNVASSNDGNDIQSQSGNMQASGNVSKYYEVGLAHNELNNAWLKKKLVQVVLNGLNLLLMRGEKIPMMITDPTSRSIRTGEGQDLLSSMHEQFCGWFYISSIEWKYNLNRADNVEAEYGKDQKLGTKWTTILTLTRREWPIPGWTENVNKVIENTNNGTGVESKVEESKQPNAYEVDLTEFEDNDLVADFSDIEALTIGLSDKLNTLWQKVKSAVVNNGYKVTLVSGRRWGLEKIPANNKTNTSECIYKIEGKSKIEENGLYEFINSKGDFVWYPSNTSRHIYGDAIDFINGDNTTINDIVKVILNDDDILGYMFTNGLYCAIETGKVDNATELKHYHIGNVNFQETSEVEGQKTWWEIVAEKNGKKFTYNGERYKYAEYAQFNVKDNTYSEVAYKRISLVKGTVTVENGATTKVDYLSDIPTYVPKNNNNSNSSGSSASSSESGSSSDSNYAYNGSGNLSWIECVKYIFAKYTTDLFHGKYSLSVLANEEQLKNCGIRGLKTARSDCSGFVSCCLNHFGLNVGLHNSTEFVTSVNSIKGFKKINWNKNLDLKYIQESNIPVGTIFSYKGHITIWAGGQYKFWDYGSDRKAYPNGEPMNGGGPNSPRNVGAHIYEVAFIPE